MRAIRVFILGVVFGVYLKWIVDQIYTMDNLRRIEDENTMLKDRIKLLESVRTPSTQSLARTLPAPAPTKRLPASTSAASKSTKRAGQKDDLKKIGGVGPAMERKLNAAGINTFEAFSRLTTREVQNILGTSKRVVQSASAWVTQARTLAQQKKAK